MPTHPPYGTASNEEKIAALGAANAALEKRVAELENVVRSISAIAFFKEVLKKRDPECPDPLPIPPLSDKSNKDIEEVIKNHKMRLAVAAMTMQQAGASFSKQTAASSSSSSSSSDAQAQRKRRRGNPTTSHTHQEAVAAAAQAAAAVMALGAAPSQSHPAVPGAAAAAAAPSRPHPTMPGAVHATTTPLPPPQPSNPFSLFDQLHPFSAHTAASAERVVPTSAGAASASAPGPESQDPFFNSALSLLFGSPHQTGAPTAASSAPPPAGAAAAAASGSDTDGLWWWLASPR